VSLFDAYVWIQANWKSFGWPLAVLFCFLWWHKVTPCEKQAVQLAQAQEQTGKASVRVQLVYKDRIVTVPGETPRLPCPDVIVDADAAQSQQHWQSVTTSAQIEPRTNVGIYAGGGWLGTPVATLGGFYGPVRVGAVASATDLGGLLTYDFKF